ncbi:Lysophospholipase L1 [Mariprofundus aestuarium]|uniref:Lysophospholipase L1 n=1 Tax=Mariprofundus aestuarium TaxID=1921086 RepID=A0A2K8L4J3_MARES|nr:GDSL-type esterase/lipase family protein [Mariprofundus aestuarium]ATX79156.1 Lysophospholipase L1 [Mariprofundus aestuarium]
MSFLTQRPLLLPLCILLLCCSSQTELPRLTPEAVILAFGDSLTYGSGARAEQAYPAVLKRLTGHKVVNAGVPGEETEDGLKRLPDVLDELQPELLILCHGGNDLIRKRGEEQAAANLRSMIVAARKRGIAVLLIAVPKPGVLFSVPEFYKSISAEMHIPIEQKVLADVLSRRSLKSDAIHPNAEGYRLMAEAVYRQLVEAGAL